MLVLVKGTSRVPIDAVSAPMPHERYFFGFLPEGRLSDV